MATYKIFGENIEQGALDQFHSALDLDCVVKAALMPDAHQGYTLPIGAVVATKNMIYPSWVGYDIGCGMCAVPTSYHREDVEKNRQAIFEMIHHKVPVGFAKHSKTRRWMDPEGRDLTSFGRNVFMDKSPLKQLGTLGGGNHFVEIGYDETDCVWIIVHSGSRGLGHGIATLYMSLACEIHTGESKAREGHYGLAADTPEGQNYIRDLNYCLAYALENREQLVTQVEECILACTEFDGGPWWDDLINRNHNHAELRDGLWVHRKGATHAETGMRGVIPGNMRDGSFIVQGKGNPEALWSSSHGAGRVLGRKAAKKTLSEDEFIYEMQGVTCSANADTLDESPMAYKNIFEVMELQKDLVEVVHHVTPIINVKG